MRNERATIHVSTLLPNGNCRLKQHNGNFRVEIPWNDLHVHHQIPKNLIERRAHKIWDRKGRPQSSAREQQVNLVHLVSADFFYLASLCLL